MILVINMYFVIIFFVLVSVVPAVIPLLSEPWDFNLFIRLQETEKGYDFPGQLSLESRGNVMALPGRVYSNGKTMDIEDETFTTPCCRNWTKTGWMKVNPKEIATTKSLLDYSFTWVNDSVPPAEIWALNGVKGSMLSPTFSSTVFKYNRNNITVPLFVFVVARLSIESSISVNLVHADESVEVLGEIYGNAENAWILQRMHLQNAEIKRSTDVRFEVIAKQPADWVTPLLIQWVLISSPSNQKTINLGDVSSPEGIENTYFTPLTATTNILERDPVCLHGGEIDVTGGRCKCQSGFTGTVCERGCGANKYGLNCDAHCSHSSDNRFCRGILNCFVDGCKCMPGLEGTRCDQTCQPGWYGNSCHQKCGHCAENEPCDRFTGRCDTGCEDGFQPPFCQKESCGLPPAIRSTAGANPRTIFFHSAIYEKKKGTYKAVCSGSLISPRFLLSAAWCFYSEGTFSVRSPARFLVLFGTDLRYEFSESTFPTGVQAQSVASIHVPQLYRGSQRSYSDDIALVEIVRPVRTIGHVGPVCMDVKGGDDEDELLDGDVGYVVGWGDLGTNCTRCIRNISEIEYVTHITCLNQVSESLLSEIGPEKFCGQFASENVDNSTLKDFGDVGSGYMYHRNGGWYIYGVKSATSPDTKHKFSAYTSVRDYADWVLTKMNGLDVQYAVMRNT